MSKSSRTPVAQSIAGGGITLREDAGFALELKLGTAN
jgi:hypothetical protein